MSLSLVAGSEEWTERSISTIPPMAARRASTRGAEPYRYDAVLFDAFTGRSASRPSPTGSSAPTSPPMTPTSARRARRSRWAARWSCPTASASDRSILLISDASLQSLGLGDARRRADGIDPLHHPTGPGTLNLTGSSLFSGPALLKNGKLLVNGVLPAAICAGRWRDPRRRRHDRRLRRRLGQRRWHRQLQSAALPQ